jgi:transcriptional regulator with XRE-family HTH domain
MWGMEVKLHKTFQRKLRDALKAKGWSQYRLAQELGIAPQAVGDYFHGRKCPGLDVVERFAKALDVDPWNLVDDQPLRILEPTA